jgi:hypothetical protein
MAKLGQGMFAFALIAGFIDLALGGHHASAWTGMWVTLAVLGLVFSALES